MIRLCHHEISVDELPEPKEPIAIESEGAADLIGNAFSVFDEEDEVTPLDLAFMNPNRLTPQD